MSKVVDRALAMVLLAILAGIAAHAMSLVVGGVLATGLDPITSALLRIISAQRGDSA